MMVIEWDRAGRSISNPIDGFTEHIFGAKKILWQTFVFHLSICTPFFSLHVAYTQKQQLRQSREYFQTQIKQTDNVSVNVSPTVLFAEFQVCEYWHKGHTGARGLEDLY